MGERKERMISLGLSVSFYGGRGLGSDGKIWEQRIGVKGVYLDIGPFTFFDGCTSIVCACGLGDVAFAGRHWDVWGWEGEYGKGGKG